MTAREDSNAEKACRILQCWMESCPKCHANPLGSAHVNINDHWHTIFCQQSRWNILKSVAMWHPFATFGIFCSCSACNMKINVFKHKKFLCRKQTLQSLHPNLSHLTVGAVKNCPRKRMKKSVSHNLCQSKHTDNAHFCLFFVPPLRERIGMKTQLIGSLPISHVCLWLGGVMFPFLFP